MYVMKVLQGFICCMVRGWEKEHENNSLRVVHWGIPIDKELHAVIAFVRITGLCFCGVSECDCTIAKRMSW